MSAPKVDAFTRAVDWTVGLFSPRRAVIRQHFRRMERDADYQKSVMTMLRARGYRAASSGKNGTPFAGGDGSADSEVLPANKSLRARARELNRDDPIANGATETFIREIVGTELRPQSRADKSVASDIEEVWSERRAFLTPADPMPFGQWQRMLAKKLLEDGEIFVKRAVTKPGEPVWFETIEADRVSTPQGVDEDRVREGVEKDAFGRVVAYWVNRKHPGEAASLLRREDFDRVPAESMRHIKLADRPGQTRGVTFFHAVLQDLRDLDLLMIASLKRVQVAACFALFIQSTQTVPDLLEVTAENYGYQLDDDIVPGGIFKLFPGETVETINPNFPTPELEPFVIMLARRIAAALGISWQAILRDWSGSTYSSARTQILADRPTMAILKALLVEGVLSWVWLTVLEDAALKGDERVSGVDTAELARVYWVADGKDWIDPLKEAKAVEVRMQLGITTLRDECDSQGKDWQEQIDQRLEEELYEQEQRKAKGLPPRVTDPAQGNGGEGMDPELMAEEAANNAAEERRLRRVA